MGGKAFPNKTRRYNADEYFRLVDKLTPLFATFASRFDVIPAYKQKPSFGDMDVLYTPSKQVDNQLLRDTFGTYDLLKNGSVWSLVVDEFQIDLIHSPADEYDYTLKYFSWNDWGNLSGKLFHKFGLKHGHNGLRLPVRADDSHLLGEIVLTLDPYEALKFADIRYNDDGYDTLEDMFASITSSKYFNKQLFSFENMNHVARIRDKKRTTYNSFLKHIEALDLADYPFDKDKSVYLPMIFDAFPAAKSQYDSLWAHKMMVDRVKEKFNGEVVSDLTGRTDKELGLLMRAIKGVYTTEMLDEMSVQEVHKMIMEIHNEMV